MNIKKMGFFFGMVSMLVTQMPEHINAQEDSYTNPPVVTETESPATTKPNEETEGESQVLQPVLEQHTINMHKGECVQLHWLHTTEDTSITYFTEEGSIVHVSSQGMIAAGEQEGNAQIRAVVVQNGVTYEETVDVTVSGVTTTGMSMRVMDIQMGLGDIYQLQPELIPSTATDRVLYSSANAEIIEVDEEGVLQAVGYGKTMVTVSMDNGTQLQCTIQVGTIASKLSFVQKDSVNIGKGQSYRLQVKILPETVSRRNLLWKSNDESIVTVQKNGKITGHKIGTTTITATTLDGSELQATLKVKVTKKVVGTKYTEKGLTIVSTNHQKYTYTEMKTDILQLCKKYPGIISYEVAGKSWDNRNIYELTLGNPEAEKVILVQASIHAREYMTAQLVMRQMEFYCANYYTGAYKGKYYSDLFEHVCFKVIPMANPDGVTISQYGYIGIRDTALRNKVRQIGRVFGRGRRLYYTTWKANARGVDLNRNFDAYWGKLATSVHFANGNGYKGPSPVSEKESQTLVRVTEKEKPTAVISYHAMGRILFWNFGQKGAERTKELKLLNTVRSMTGYSPVMSFSTSHSTGFGDWIAIKKKLPTVTIEIGNVSCPLPQWQFSGVWAQNKQVLAAVAYLYR